MDTLHLPAKLSRGWGFLAIGVTCSAWLFAGVASVVSASQAVTARAAVDDYRSWTALNPTPLPVSSDLALQCAPVTAAQIEKTRLRDGPHTNRWVRVYANAAAVAALRDKRVTVFPAGAMLAKEKLVSPDDPRTEGVAFMIKHAAGEFVESGGWEFVYRPAGAAAPAYEGCVACHRAGGAKDYVFARYSPER